MPATRSAIAHHGLAQAEAYYYAHQFDKAIEICKKIIADNPTFGIAHRVWHFAYWAEHKYPQAIQELKIAAQLVGDKNDGEFAAALDAGFRSGGWPSALRKAVEVILAQRKAKAGYISPYQIAQVYADLGDKDHAFEWLNTAYQEQDFWLNSLRTEFTVGFPSLRSPLRRTGAQNRFPAIVTLAVLFPRISSSHW